jgi:hypothetical protein
MSIEFVAPSNQQVGEILQTIFSHTCSYLNLVMRTLLFFTCCVALIFTIKTAIAQNNHSSFVNSESMTTFSNQQSNDSSGYQQSIINLNAANLNQPHILSVSTSGTELHGEISVDGKVLKQLSKNTFQMNLSPYLSLGQHTVEISARYAPASSSASMELNGPGINVTQQTSGNGTLNYSITVTVQ